MVVIWSQEVIAANVLDNMWALSVPFKLRQWWNLNCFHDIVWAHMSAISQGTKFRIDIALSIQSLIHLPLSLYKSLLFTLLMLTLITVMTNDGNNNSDYKQVK